MGPVVWDVIGSELSLREHVARQAGVKRVTVHEARGRLDVFEYYLLDFLQPASIASFSEQNQRSPLLSAILVRP